MTLDAEFVKALEEDYTRAPITSQREARTVHGADDFVSKQDGPEPMLARVVTQFRRG